MAVVGHPINPHLLQFKNKQVMTNVIFLYEKTGDGVFAFFPEMVHNFNGYRPDNMTCYSHIGQHSPCHPDYVKECKEAAINDYWPLLQELIGQGYNDLQIMNEQTRECHRPQTKGEIRFGEGATHYRDFPLSVIGLKKGKAELKNWFKAPDDGLRYYTR